MQNIKQSLTKELTQILRKFRRQAMLLFVLIASSILPNQLKAEENLWIYTVGTDTRPQGSFEAKLSDIMMRSKSSGKYVRHEARAGLEYGLTDRLTVGANLIVFKHDYSVKNSDLDPMYTTQGEEGGAYNHTAVGGYQAMMKYNILSPYKDLVGLSLGFTFDNRERYRLDGANINQKSYISRIFLQKNWLDDRLTWAFNAVSEFERRKAGEVLEEEIALEFMSGLSYRFAPKHFIGFEWRHQRDHLTPTEAGESLNEGHQKSNFDLNNFRIGTNHQYANYVGPTYHFAEQNWWFTIGALWQVSGGGKADRGINNDGKNWDEHERVHLGGTIGYEF